MNVFGKERDYIVHDENNIKGFFGDYRFLSNYHKCPVWFEGVLYTSTEAAYQAAKSEDSFIRLQFKDLEPNDAKKLGQKIQHRSNWHNIKYDIMSSIVFEKFFRNQVERNLLINTNNKYLEETNHWGDQYWGVSDGKGENSLGRILMGVRQFWIYKDLSNPVKPGTPLF